MKIRHLDFSKQKAEADLARLLTDIATKLDQQDAINERIFEQLVELTLRMRYVMESITYTKTSPIVGVPPDIKTMYELYLTGDRERFLAKIEEANRAHLSANDGGTATSPGARADAYTDASLNADEATGHKKTVAH